MNMEPKNCWVVVSNIFYFHPYLGKIPNLTSIFVKWVETTNQIGVLFRCASKFSFPRWHFQVSFRRHKNRGDWFHIAFVWDLGVGLAGAIKASWRFLEVEQTHMGVSKNRGTPKSSISIGFFIIFTIHFGGFPPIFGSTPICAEWDWNIYQSKKTPTSPSALEVVPKVFKNGGSFGMINPY